MKGESESDFRLTIHFSADRAEADEFVEAIKSMVAKREGIRIDSPLSLTEPSEDGDREEIPATNRQMFSEPPAFTSARRHRRS